MKRVNWVSPLIPRALYYVCKVNEEGQKERTCSTKQFVAGAGLSPFNRSRPVPSYPVSSMTAGSRTHCISHINKAQRVPNRLAPHHVYTILCNAKEAFGRINFDKVILNRPPIGDCFFELKGLEVDISQVPLGVTVDDGYDWRGPVKRNTIPIGSLVQPGSGVPPLGSSAGLGLEVTQFFGGFWEPDPSLGVVRVEYRLLVPNNRVFLVHYLLLDSNGATVIPPDLGGGGTVNPANVFQPPQTNQHQQQQQQYMGPRPIPPQMPMKPPMMPQPQHIQRPIQQQQSQSKVPLSNRAKVGTGKAAPASTTAAAKPASQEDPNLQLHVDDDTLTKIDVAYARSKFQRTLMSLMFTPSSGRPLTHASREEEDNCSTEVHELLEGQAALLKGETEALDNLRVSLSTRDEDRRKDLNRLFLSLMETDDIDSVFKAWESIAGYSMAPEMESNGMEIDDLSSNNVNVALVR